MKRWIWAFLLLLVTTLCDTTAQQTVKNIIDLRGSKDDKVTVTVFPPAFQSRKIIYQLPAVIPGSYEIKNYSRFIEDFRAYDAKGNLLKSKTNRKEQFVIRQGQQVAKIKYTVNDTWDDSLKMSYIFPPGGTHFKKNKNYVLNLFTLIGFFQGFEGYAYEVDITPPDGMFGYPRPDSMNIRMRKDHYSFDSYADLADQPVMYAQNDTLSFYQGNSHIQLCTYSPNKIVTSEQLKPFIKEVMQAMENFFGTLPVNEYTFLLYFAGEKETKITRFDEFGALEHKHSSFYFLPELENEKLLRETVQTIAAHEFLHILTPLGLSTENIAHFDFSRPATTQHLWLYEGVIEYLSNWALLVNGSMTKDEFILDLRRKLIQAEKYDEVSFTKMSKKIFKEPYADMYANVYYKGALLAFFLDIEINELSDGTKNLRNVLLDINKKYPSGVFPEKKLIRNIVELVDPKLSSFFDTYIHGIYPLPVEKYLKKPGWTYYPQRADSTLTFGNVFFSYHPESQTYIVEPTHPKQNLFRLNGGEKVKKINGEMLTKKNYMAQAENISNPKNIEKVIIQIEKSGMSYTTEAEPIKVGAFHLHEIKESAYPTPSEIQLRKWLFDW